VRIGILTISDSRAGVVAAGSAETGGGATAGGGIVAPGASESDGGSRSGDGSGDAIELWAELRGATVPLRHLVPDDEVAITSTIAEWCDGGRVDLVLTTGGTGLSPRDVTPEATRAVIERDAPGIAELLRVSALPRVPRAALSRGIAGIRHGTLVINLPGSTRAVEHALSTLDPLLDHAVALVSGQRVDHR
jgi:molybdopterin adenylyltransferase